MILRRMKTPSRDVAAGGELDKDWSRQDDRQNRQEVQKRRWRRSRRPAIIASSLACLVLIAKQLHAYVIEYQGPLDHVSTSILAPFYGMMCPRRLDTPSRQTRDWDYWECGERDAESFPRIFMIGARGKDEDSYESWRKALGASQNAPYMKRINTLELSNRFALQGGMLSMLSEEHGGSSKAKHLCRKMKWEQRLFYVYQAVFQDVLSTYPTESGFVFVEDDAVMNEQEVPLLKAEICRAHADARSFYSLYRSPLQWGVSSCIYRHGTVAFYIRRGLMEIIANERRREQVCRFPIDMYISRLGPWYAPRQEIVMHSGVARVGSTP